MYKDGNITVNSDKNKSRYEAKDFDKEDVEYLVKLDE